MQAICKVFVEYFRSMAGKTDTRVARAYTFTFDEPTDKERYAAHAKKQGRTLAGLIKYLLDQDRQKHEATPPPPGA
jgi:hypothetical protein